MLTIVIRCDPFILYPFFIIIVKKFEIVGYLNCPRSQLKINLNYNLKKIELVPSTNIFPGKKFIVETIVQADDLSFSFP